MQENDSILSAQSLSIGYRQGGNVTTVMQGLDLQLHRGCLTALLGRNGIGKSTLLRTIAGAQPALAGAVWLDGNFVGSYSPREVSRKLSLVYTDRTQAGGLTVEQLVELGRYPYTGFFGRLDSHDRDVVANAMAATGIDHKRDSFVAELSDGERQKAMIARALAQETPVIMLDEPTAFLDVASRIEVMTLLHNLAHGQNKAVLLSTHDISQTLLLADELWIVTDDRKVLCGCTEDLILSGGMQQLFPSCSGMAFDMLHGDFEMSLNPEYRYDVECADPVLRRWVANALRRNGISPDGGTEGKVEVSSRSDITVSCPDGKRVKCRSMAGLVSCIRNKR